MKIKIIHTADLHLDSSMSAYLPREKAKERKNELLLAFDNIVKYAEKEGIFHILIAGDMFDKKVLTEKVVRYVEKIILNHPDISFYYLNGNHDSEGFLERIELPQNLFTFSSDRWSLYSIEEEGKRICIYGTELQAETQAQRLTELQPAENDVNIVMLHGQEADYVGKDKEVRIDLPRLRGKAIDYLALGHVHKPKAGHLDARGIYSYPGCPEGRGFDECGARGFNILTIDTDSGKTEMEFLPSSIRRVEEIKTDITGAPSTLVALEKVEKVLEEAINQNAVSASDLVKIILTGELEMEAEIDADLITKQLEHKFYFLKTVDETGRRIDYTAFRKDMSLKGEFVRMVEKDDSLTEEEKTEIIRTGILLLAGRKEEV